MGPLRFTPSSLLAVLVVGTLLLLGCAKHPPGPAGPEITSAGVAERAMAQLDENSDGQLSEEEWKQSPGLASAIERFDSNSDSVLSREEIATRIQTWLDSGTTIMSGSTQVTMGGRPLAEANITYEPEPFLGPAFKPGNGTTDKHGVADMRGQDAEFPGVYVGLYRVKISKKSGGKEIVPERYNSETTLGVEIAEDHVPVSGMVTFEL